MTEQPSWLKGILLKRSPRVIQILIDLCEAGIARGQCSANDVTVELPKNECNAIGAAFKILYRFGFKRTDHTVITQKRQKHKRRVFIWELDDTLAAQRWIDELRRHLLNAESKEYRQAKLI